MAKYDESKSMINIFSHFNIYLKMPKFIKGSPEAAQFMKDLRAKRGTKTSTHKAVKKEHIKKLLVKH
jgi:hypothetical protein